MHEDILRFWFEEVSPDKWWTRDEDFDREISHRFGDVHRSASRCELFEWRKTARGRLAEIIVLDQFSRNMFRGTARAFATDPLALALAQEAISQGVDKKLSPTEKSFLFLPFMHSESPVIQTISVELYTTNHLNGNIKHALEHKETIDEFGRFPYRNEALGRTSTPEELAYLISRAR